MNVSYAKLSPTGNDTVLVSTPVPRALHGALAARLLEDPAVGGEQVGYVEPPADARAAARLQMMGGEFCGNATMALGALLARDAGLADGAAMDMAIEVSGSGAPVPCRIVREGEGWRGTVSMPLPTGIEEVSLPADGGTVIAPAVVLPGITHLILPGCAGLDETALRRLLPAWAAMLGADALGALDWDAEASSIDPLVFVPSAGTLVREHGCGSGSAAIGSWLALRAGHSLSTDVRQPGGVITVDARIVDGALSALAITGYVRLMGEGTAEAGED